jgi:phage shock protein A
MDDDTDLSGLDLAAAKEYILEFAVEAKRLDKELAAAEAEAALWKGRVALAEGKALGELATAARSKVAEAEGKISALEAERSSVRSKVEAMRLRLPSIRAAERSIDPDRLLAELQLMTGELLGEGPPGMPEGGRSDAAVNEDFSKLENGAAAEADLAALKRKMTGNGGEGAGAQ